MSADEFRRQYRRPQNKYGAKKTTLDGITFDSMAEARHYQTLKLRERAGEITNLEIHPSYPLWVNDALVARYVADFRYRERDGTLVVVDVKGGKATITPTFRLKAKLMLALYDIAITEVTA